MGATLRYDSGDYRLYAADRVYAPGEVVQLPDGAAAVVAGLSPHQIGDPVEFYRQPREFDFPAASGVEFALGETVYWDASAKTAINAGAAAPEDFPVGPAQRAKATGQTSVAVLLNGVQTSLLNSVAVGVRGVAPVTLEHDDAAEHEIVGAADAEAAAESIHNDAWPRAACGGMYGPADWAAVLPGALVWVEARKGFAKHLSAWSTGGEFLSAGTLGIELMEVTDPLHVDDNQARDAHWQQRVGQILDELCGLVGTPGLLDFQHIEISKLYYPLEKFFPVTGHVSVAELTVKYDEAGR